MSTLAILDEGMAAGVDPQNPWPGLQSFTEDQREYFHGRDADSDELLRLVRREALTVLYGQSGLGKTSLLRAGLFPKLRDAAYLPIYIRLLYSPNSPALREQVTAAIEALAASTPVEFPDTSAEQTLWEYLHRREAYFWVDKTRLVTPVFVFDQFEEIFTQGRSNPETRKRVEGFLEELSDLVENRVPIAVQRRIDEDESAGNVFDFKKVGYKVLICLREDFLPELEELRELLPGIALNRQRVNRMDGVQALSVALGAGGHLVDGDVAARIIHFVAASSAIADETGSNSLSDQLAKLQVEPSLLSVVCRELNNKRRAAGLPRITSDLLVGNRREILTDFYQRTLEDVDPRVREFVEDRLLTRSGYRDDVPLNEALAEPGVDERILQLLVNRRLLRVEERFGVDRVELTHDVLIEPVRRSRDSRHQRKELERAKSLEADARQRTQQIAAELAKARRRIAVVCALCILFLALAVWAWKERAAAKIATKEAKEQKEKADKMTAQAMQSARDSQRRLSQLSVERHLSAAKKDQHDHAAIWLNSAREIEQALGQTDVDRRPAINHELSFVSRTSWMSQPLALPDREAVAADGSIWIVTDSGELLRGVKGDQEWHFSEPFPQDEDGQQESWKDVIYLPALKQLVALDVNKIVSIDPAAEKTTRLYPEPGKTEVLSETLAPSDDGKSLYVTADNRLLRIGARNGTVQQKWRLADLIGLNVFSQVVDEGRGKAVFQVSKGDQRWLVVSDLAAGREIARLPRYGGSVFSLARHDNHVVFLSSDAPAQLTCIDLDDPSKTVQKRMAQKGTQLAALDNDGITLCAGGQIRRFTYGAMPLAESGGSAPLYADAFFAGPDGVWVFDKGVLSHRPAPNENPDCASIAAPAANHIAVVDSSRFLVCTPTQIEVRRIDDNRLLTIFPFEADEAVMDAPSNRLYYRKGTTLVSYDTAGEKELARRNDCQGGLIALAGGRGVLARCNGLRRFDSDNLGIRELLSDAEIVKAEADDQGIWFIERNTAATQLDVAQYRWSDARRHGPVAIPVDAAQVTAAALTPDHHGICIGLSDGSIKSCPLPAEIGTQTSISPDDIATLSDESEFNRSEPPVIMDHSDPHQLIVVRSNGQVDRLRAFDGHYFPSERHVPLPGENLAQLLPVRRDGKYLISSGSGAFGVLEMASAGGKNFGPQYVARAGIACYPHGPGVLFLANGRQVNLGARIVDPGNFYRALLSDDGQIIVGAADQSLYVWSADAINDPESAVSEALLLADRAADMRFIGPRTIGVISSGDYYEIDVSAASSPKLIHHLKCDIAGDAMQYFARTSNAIVTAGEAQPKLFVWPRGGGNAKSISLPEEPRSIGNGPDDDTIIVGGLRRVLVVSLKKLAVTGEIAIPSVGSYYIRSTCCLPGGQMIAAGDRMQIHLIDCQSMRYDLSIPVSDYVWRLALSNDKKELLWQGDVYWGDYPLNDTMKMDLTTQQVDDWTGLTLSDGSIHWAKPGFELLPAKSK